MILENSKSAKICINEHDYLALVDAATDILDAIEKARTDRYVLATLPAWITNLDTSHLENALQALGEI